jgi:hypothetical protein
VSGDTPPMDERELAVGALRALALLAVPVAGGAAWLVGWNGAVSALIGLGFVLVLFGASAALLVWVAGRPGIDGAGSVGILVVGAMVRLPLYVAALFGLTQLSWVHGRSLAAATGIAVAVTLAYELRLLSRMPRLFWVDAQAGGSTTAANDARSQPL